MTEADKADIKARFPDHYFLRVLKDGWQAIVAVPKKQATPEKQAATELWHGATATLHNG